MRAAGCLSANTLQGWVAGALSTEVRGRAQRHIETCADCRVLAFELARDSEPETIDVAAPAPAAFAAGASRELADRFEILRPLGQGGMGVVYEALDRERGARVALKTLQHVSPDGLLRFKTEFRALQDVQHPNVVTFGDLIEDGGRWWLTMELIEGAMFLDHVRPGRRLDEGRLRAALPQLAAALAALHAHGLVHRDVKPQNVRVTPAGRLVLLDLGLVASVAQSESRVVGTPAYMAPEQALGDEVGPAADWYGVGALLYEALTGTLPFEGAPLQVLQAKQLDPPRRPGALASVPADLEALCMQLLAIKPAARLGAVQALAGLDPGVPAASPPAAVTAPPPFVGRRRELAQLGEAFAETRAGAGAIVLVEGESGIGKSALVERFLEDLHGPEPALLVLAGRCYERETVPYKGVDGVVDALARYLRRLPEADAAAVLPRRAGLLVQAFPVLGKVPALRGLPADPVIDPTELRTRAFTALRELLGRLAERRPVVVWIDDLQWADADSLELLAWVMARPEAPPLLLVLTSRPSQAAGCACTETARARVRALTGLRLLELTPLPRADAVALAERLLAEHPASTAAGAAAVDVADEAAGHPLFIDALVRHTAARAIAHPPLRLSDALWARIAELDPPARQLLALTAVAGWPLPLAILAAADVVPAGEIDPALARLRRAHLVRVASGARSGAIEPYHDRVREAVLDRLDPELRRACHRALARALRAVTRLPEASPSPDEAAAATAPPPASSTDAWGGPEAIGVHLHGAGDLSQAARYLVLAADHAAAELAFDCAARLYRQALAVDQESGASPGPLGDRRDVLARLACVLVNACRGTEAAAVYFELAHRAKAAGEEDLELRLRGAEQLLRGGHRAEGRRALAQVLDELDLRPPSTRAGALWRLLWRRAWVRIRGFRALARGSPAAGGGAPSRERLRLEACLVAWMTLELMSTKLGAEYVTRYQLLAPRTGDPRCMALALSMEVHVALMRGGAGARRTERLLAELSAAAERHGDPYLLGLERMVRALSLIELGHWARGRELVAQATQLLRERCLGTSYEVANAAGIHFLSLLHQGDLRALLRESQPMLREAEERGDHYTLVLHLFFWNLMALVGDQPQAARQQLERAIAMWVPLATDGEVPDLQLLLGHLARVEIDLYEGDGAAAYARIAQRWCRRIALPIARMKFVRARMLSLHGVAALAACRARGLDRRLVRAAARDARALRAMRLPWTRALARILDFGVALATGARDAARAQLARAHAELAAAGMSLHAALARRRLGELDGGAEGARAIAEADAWLAAQGVRAPERLARLYLPEVA